MRGIVLPLALAQIAFWAGTFYLFPAFLPIWEVDPGWAKSTLTAAFTVSLLISAMISPVAGRLIDRGHGQTAMVGGCLLGVAALVLLAVTRTQTGFFAAWAMLGIARAPLLYDACFALVTVHLAGEARRAITRITLIAGFAGTVSFPLAHLASGAVGWRGAVLGFAALMLVCGLPLALTGLRRLMRNHPARATHAPALRNGAAQSLRLRWLAGAFLAVALNHGMIVTHLLPLLAERGVPQAFAVAAAAAIGPMQVAGRLALMAGERRVSAMGSGFACLLGMALAALCLAYAGASILVLALFVLLQGAAYGIASIARPVLTRELLGEAGFGLVSGRLGGIFLLGTAIAPFLGAQLWTLGGYDLMIGTALLCTVGGALALRRAARMDGV